MGYSSVFVTVHKRLLAQLTSRLSILISGCLSVRINETACSNDNVSANQLSCHRIIVEPWNEGMISLQNHENKREARRGEGMVFCSMVKNKEESMEGRL